MKIFVVGKTGYTDFHRLFKTPEVTSSLDDAEIVIFTGGADISPMYYGQQKSKRVGFTNHHRDVFEMSVFKKAVKKNIPIVGICRGAQLCSIMSGHSLIQHVTGHSGSHEIEFVEPVLKDGYSSPMLTKMTMPANHHQMMHLDDTKSNYTLIAKADSLSTMYINDENVSIPVDVEPEIVHFKDTNALAIQPHPEWDVNDSNIIEVFRYMVDKYLFKPSTTKIIKFVPKEEKRMTMLN